MDQFKQAIEQIHCNTFAHNLSILLDQLNDLLHATIRTLDSRDQILARQMTEETRVQLLLSRYTSTSFDRIKEAFDSLILLGFSDPITEVHLYEQYAHQCGVSGVPEQGVQALEIIKVSLLQRIANGGDPQLGEKSVGWLKRQLATIEQQIRQLSP